MADMILSKELIKSAPEIHRELSKSYNAARETMLAHGSNLYRTRIDTIMLLEMAEHFVNTITQMPKELKNKLKIQDEIKRFRKTECYFKKRSNEIKQISQMLQRSKTFYEEADLASIATVFGEMATDAAINILLNDGIQQKRYSLSWCDGVWIGGGVVSSDEKIVTEQLAIWALAGPVRIAVPRPIAISRSQKVFLWLKKREIANHVFAEIKKMMVAKDAMDEASDKISALARETQMVKEKLAKQLSLISAYGNTEYEALGQDEKAVLETLVDCMVSLGESINTVMR